MKRGLGKFSGTCDCGQVFYLYIWKFSGYYQATHKNDKTIKYNGHPHKYITMTDQMMVLGRS